MSEFTIPDGVSRQQAMQSILDDAIARRGGNYSPGDRLFTAGQRDSIKYALERAYPDEVQRPVNWTSQAATNVPISAPGVLSSTGAARVASAAQSSASQAKTVLATAARNTVTELATQPKTVAGALPIVGTVGAAVYETAQSRAKGKPWAESVGRGIGGAAGGALGFNLGIAGGTAASANPVVGAGVGVAGGIAGGAAGAAIGGGIARGAGNIPGVIARSPIASGMPIVAIPRAIGGALGIPPIFDDGGNASDTPNDIANNAANAPGITLIPQPIGHGGQGNRLYKVSYELRSRTSTYMYGAGEWTEWQTVDNWLPFNELRGPITSPARQIEDFQGNPNLYDKGISFPFKANGVTHYINLGGTTGRPYAAGVGFPYEFRNFKATRLDGQPNALSDLAGPPVPTPTDNRNTAPYTPTPNPASPNRPPVSPMPSAPSAPAAPPSNSGSPSPIPQPAPPTDPANSGGLPFADPADSPSSSPANSGAPSPAPKAPPSGSKMPDTATNPDGTLKDGTATFSNGTTVTTKGDTTTISSPVTATSVFTIPGIGTVQPGKSISVSNTAENASQINPLIAGLGPGLITGLPRAAAQIIDSAEPKATPNQPPGEPPKSPPVDSPCRCNSAILDRFDLLEKKIGVDTIAGGAGDVGVLAYLQKMQAFAEKAWQTTRIQKVINALTLITTIHNAAMLSRFTGQTLLEAMSGALDLFGIDDEKGERLDLNGMLGKSVEGLLKNVLGEQVYNDTSKAWKKASRIIQVGSNMVWTMRSMMDTSFDLQEYIANNTGKIGNSLKRFGIVGENAFPDMSESARAQNKWRNKMDRYYQGLESVEETAESIEYITQAPLEIASEFSELKEQKDELKKTISDASPVDYPANQPIANQQAENKANSQGAEATIEASLKDET